MLTPAGDNRMLALSTSEWSFEDLLLLVVVDLYGCREVNLVVLLSSGMEKEVISRFVVGGREIMRRI